jgi:hypothetical protein
MIAGNGISVHRLPYSFYIPFWLQLEHGASMKLSISLQFLYVGQSVGLLGQVISVFHIVSVKIFILVLVFELGINSEKALINRTVCGLFRSKLHIKLSEDKTKQKLTIALFTGELASYHQE